jgi:predicted aspartyl protease
MKTILIMAVAMLLTSCAAPRLGDDFAAIYTPTVSWGSVDTVTLPLDTVSEAGHLDFFIITLPVNGNPARFMVDSGTNKTWFTKQFSKKIGAKVTGLKIFAHGAGGNREQEVVLLDVADIGLARLHGLYVTSGDILKDMNRSIATLHEEPIAGILGLDILVPLGASIDLAHSTITFRRRPNNTSEPGSPSQAGSPQH